MQTAMHNSAKRLRRRPLGRYRYVRLRWRVMFTLIDIFGAVLFSVARLARRSFTNGSPAKTDDPRRILLIQLDHMGDAIITTVMLPLLRRRYPAASIEVLCGPWNRELFAAMKEVDRVHVSRLNRFIRGDSRALFNRFAWAGAVFTQGLRLRRRKYDLGIDVRGEFPHVLMLWLAGVQRRLGWTSGGGGFLLTDTAPFLPDRPEVESRLALLAELGITPADSSEALPRFKPTVSAERSVTTILDELGTGDNVRKTRVALHISAGTTAKRWPVEHWRTLLSMLRNGNARDSDLQVILIGGPADREISQRVLGNRRLNGVADFTGRLSVVELAALLQRVDLLIGGDSGPVHLATAVETPVVALFSGTNNHRQWQPCGHDVAVVRHQVACGPCHLELCPLAGHPCMHKLQPAEVARAASRYISINANRETDNDDSSASTATNEKTSPRSAHT